MRRLFIKLLLLAPALAMLLAPAGAAQAAFSAPGTITGLRLTAVSFDPTLKHNIVDLAVTMGSQSGTANFLDFYNQNGGLTRWGYPTSEVFQEEPGNLAQYFQRGVLDWHWRTDLGAYVIDRRLAWDYFGGDRAGAGQDQGTEAGTKNPNGGEAAGPWGHTVSDQAVDGTQIGFRAFFDSLGGVQSFGYPKSEARADTAAAGTLHVPSETPGFIRQYFQGAILEYHPESVAAPVELTLLGDELRDKLYPNGSWEQIGAFSAASPETPGQAIGLVSLAGTPLVAPAFQVNMPSSVPQGGTFQLKVLAPTSDQVSATYDGAPMHLFPEGDAWLGYLGYNPVAAVRSHTIVVNDGDQSETHTFNITRVQWPVENIDETPQQLAVTQGNNVADENAMMAPYFLTYTPQQLWNGPFIYPVTAPLTDGFGVMRSYNHGPVDDWHEGRDLGAFTGTPIHASASGKVVIARPLTVRGNGVVIDHGLGVFTGYYHQSQILVHEGQMVNKGDVIGLSGATGFATGPHVHWEVRIGNVYVDPDQWSRTAFGV